MCWRRPRKTCILYKGGTLKRLIFTFIFFFGFLAIADDYEKQVACKERGNFSHTTAPGDKDSCCPGCWATQANQEELERKRYPAAEALLADGQPARVQPPAKAVEGKDK